MWNSFMSCVKSFWKKHIVAEFPVEYPNECFDCNKGNCKGCYLTRRFKS